jgi:hypothetical protein
MTSKPSPRARKILDAQQLIVAWKIMQESPPGYEGRQRFLDWIEGGLKNAGWIRIGKEFYRRREVEKLTKLQP